MQRRSRHRRYRLAYNSPIDRLKRRFSPTRFIRRWDVADLILRFRGGGQTLFVMASEMKIDCAAAADGGSLMVVLPEVLGGDHYVLIRSIASRYTDQYERICGPQGILSSEDENQLGTKISEIILTIQSGDPCNDILEEFIKVLTGRNAFHSP